MIFLKKIKEVTLYMLLILFVISCSKKPNDKPEDDDHNPPVDYPDPKDPETTATIGFFMDNWTSKTFVRPGYSEVTKPSASPDVTVEVDASKVLTKIPHSLFGQNSVSYVRSISNEEPLLSYLGDLKPRIIRFPGGSIADMYFWNGAFNTKPEDAPDYLYDNNQEKSWIYNYWYGKNNPDKRANLDDYYALIQKTGSEGMLTVNYAYARYGLSVRPVEQAAHYAADWVRYDNGRTKYWQIGNENYGSWEKGFRINTANNKDGQPEYLTGKLYAQHAKIFMDSMRNAAQQTGKEIFIGVEIIEEYSDWLWNNSSTASTWNSSVMSEMKTNGADFYSIHSYFLNNDENTFQKIINSARTKPAAMMKYVKDDMTKNGLPVHPISLTEYNIYAVGSAGSQQQVSFVNGMHTTIVLCEALKNNLGSAVRWDIANGWDNGADHGMFNMGDEPNAQKWNPRPVFYYMYYLQKMLGDRLLPAKSSDNDMLSYASSFSSGEKSVVLINTSAKQKTVKIDIKNANIGERFYYYILIGGDDNGDFSKKVYVNGTGPSASANGGPASSYKTLKAKSSVTSDGIIISLPSRSVAFMVIDKHQ